MARARLLAWTIAFAAFMALPPCVRAEEPVRLEVKWTKGALWSVEQSLDLSSANKGVAVVAGGAGTAQMLVKGHVVATEKWTDEGAKEEEGRLTQCKRTYQTSKIAAQKKPAVATTLQGTTLLLGVEGDRIAVDAPAGSPVDDLVRSLLSKGPLDPVEILLPKDPVAVGAGWDVATEDVMKFQAAICIGVAAVKGSARDDLGLLLKSLRGESPASAAKIVKARLAAVENGVARIEFADDKTDDAKLDGGFKGPLFDVPPATTKIEGVLTLDVAKGRPIRLEWSQVHDMGDFSPGPNVPGGGAKIPGFTETWKLTKTWK